jgi:hypothetical protein
MNMSALLKLGVVTGVVLNILDFIVQGNLLAGMYAANPAFRNTDDVIPYLVAGDFVAAFVFCWAYLKLGAATGSGAGGGAAFGMYAGVLVGFPTWIFVHLLVNGVPYGMMWVLTIWTVIAYVIIGAVAGALRRA